MVTGTINVTLDNFNTAMSGISTCTPPVIDFFAQDIIWHVSLEDGIREAIVLSSEANTIESGITDTKKSIYIIEFLDNKKRIQFEENGNIFLDIDDAIAAYKVLLTT